ncbi:hypothetical protein [Achromobacter arsenitoxydans]|uniref:HeH/LEM domain-containing protein n=1 Tax=Achromobacter arsenitoxydans SY8 TaxID=477184 RepID=H0F9M9_9BURK|nr:hypothetical protein [Achromobacter arsenitoxydans]EHK65294.1 hypothetical protein KYC_17407 [Achromobacter arsenitoxydans SY8]
MPYYTNTTKAVINIGGHTVIAPTKSAQVDPETRGVQDLIKRGMLVEAEVPADGRPAGKKRGQASNGTADEKEPSTVVELKKWLDGQGAQYDASANKAELQGLYEALKASAEQ